MKNIYQNFYRIMIFNASALWSGTNRIVVRKNGNDGGKTDRYTVNDAQKSSKQQKVAN